MKKWQKVLLSIVLAIILLIGIVIGGYYIYVNRKVDTRDVIALSNYDNLALSATITNNSSKESKKLTDGKHMSGITVKDGENIYVSFADPITCNTIVLDETLNKVGSIAYALEGGTKQFSIYASLNGEETLIYRNDKIDTYRMCTFPDTTLDSLRIQFDSTRGSAKINELEIYNVAKTKTDFRVNDYFVYEGEDYQHNEKFLNYLDSITDLTMFIGVNIDENANVTYDETFKEKLDDIKTAVGDRDIKLFCEINLFPEGKDSAFLSENSKLISKNISAFLTEFDLDGADFDWEYPRGKQDWNAYNQFCVDLHEELSKVGKKFSLATAVWNMRFSDEAKEAVDYFNIMIYDHVTDDYNGYHSTFKETTLAIERLYYQGYDMSKINLGIPYYGRNLNNSEVGNFWVNYDASMISDPWTNAMCENYGVTDGEIGAYFNGRAIVRDKVCYAVAMNCGGIMTWHMMSDLPIEDPLSLHSAVNEALDQYVE